MEPITGKHARDEGLIDNVSGVDSKRAKPLPPVVQEKLRRDEERRRIEATYADLPLLPPRIPAPEYLVHGETAYSKDVKSVEFYTACARGDLGKVRSFAENLRPPHMDLQYGLEKAAHMFHIDVVRYLLNEQGVKIHTRVFERKDNTRPWAQNIFLYGNPLLLEILEAFLDNGWHPNQILGLGREKVPNQILGLEREKVALHYIQCVKNLPILRFLLEHGADPTIARSPYRSPAFQRFPDEAPVRRKSGDVLNLAATEAPLEAIDLLLSHGAKLEYGRPLHSLIQRFPAANQSGDTTVIPIDPARYKMAKHLISLGEDIDGLKDISDIVKPYSMIPIGGHFKATPLSHAAGCQDWAFAEWLLENGADPEASDRRAFRGDDMYYYGHNNGRLGKLNKNALIDLIDKVQKRKASDL